MPKPKRVLCMMDMSTIGRVSLALALPALSACGVQCCPLPTSLFSNHTGGFKSIQLLDTSAWAAASFDTFLKDNISFDAVYIGYLCAPEQVTLAKRILEAYPRAFRVVDPAFADDGKTYDGISPQVIEGMRELCRMADLITPNLTETALLADEAHSDKVNTDLLLQRLEKTLPSTASALVTSVPTENAEKPMSIFGRDATGGTFLLPLQYLPQSYPGTGDLFTAALLGLMLAGLPLQEATRATAEFVFAAVKATFEGGGAPRSGLWFEPCLPLLTRKCPNFTDGAEQEDE